MNHDSGHCLNYDKEKCHPISRRTAIKAIEELQDCYNGFSDTYDKACIIGALEEVPTIDPVKHGKWIFENKTWFHQPLLKCSFCGRRQFFARFDYCPYCGTKMDLEGEANEE